ncbi:hypothetical protein LA345_25870 [Burkholderia vietnamiensis]|uniref:Uncharacterized protein n=1 Tax=Burkholderia vietnamiensis (strain G4 / LMG 22486) TaxID=269482 RepID=A4JD30_BURVG|nr:hypothetical protein [Burkholderia vietnamiensis]ABO54183.1 hypothetical protein Bcep1808_1172 [Burkholderia vietnamiensis G4]MCB4347315.1 hypothetical protein [Burkholderia vietnamiensis]
MSDVQTDTQVDNDQQTTDTQQVDQQQPEQRQQPDTSWVPKRISEITAARRAAEARAEQAEAELARLRAQSTAGTDSVNQQSHAAPSSQSVEELAKAYAARMVREQTEQQTLQSRIAAINEAGSKEFGDDFEKATQNLNMAGIGGPEFLRVLTSIDGAEKLVTWLGKTENLNEAMRIASLDPVQMGIEMTKLAPKAAKSLSKQISKAPPPIDPLEGGGGASDGSEPDPKDTQKWMEWRRKNARRR